MLSTSTPPAFPENSCTKAQLCLQEGEEGRMSQNRYVVVPTVTVLAVMKARLTGAVKGHALLKKKADALTVR